MALTRIQQPRLHLQVSKKHRCVSTEQGAQAKLHPWNVNLLLSLPFLLPLAIPGVSWDGPLPGTGSGLHRGHSHLQCNLLQSDALHAKRVCNYPFCSNVPQGKGQGCLPCWHSSQGAGGPRGSLLEPAWSGFATFPEPCPSSYLARLAA